MAQAILSKLKFQIGADNRQLLGLGVWIGLSLGSLSAVALVIFWAIWLTFGWLIIRNIKTQ